MKFITYNTPQEFYPVVEDFLFKDEITNVLTIRLLRSAKENDDYSKCLYCIGLVDGSIEIALIIHGLHLILVTDKDDHLKEAADFMNQSSYSYPGVVGPRPYVDKLVEYLNENNENNIDLFMSQKIYRLDQVSDIEVVEGSMRFAEMKDLDTVVDWTEDFAQMDNVLPDMDKIRLSRINDIENKKLFIWEVNNQPVTMTSLKESTKTSGHVGLVYTPPEERRKGYATNLVAEVSRYALKTYDYCTLYTDLGNPISNSIYMKIGYNPIADSAMYLKKETAN